LEERIAVTLRRSGYFIGFIAAVLYFAAHMALGHLFAQSDQTVTRSVGLFVLLLGLYVTQEDKAYLVSSIPLRMAMGCAAALGLVVIFLSPH
jgi:hypothetical protein